jgi:histidinol-phosphatase (PHP family)
MWSNFHSHCNYCDGKQTLPEYLEAARKFGFTSIGFSSHAPVPFECKWCMKEEDLKSYLSDIESLRSEHEQVEIFKSLEIDFVPGVISPNDFQSFLDYTIGSIHFVEAFRDGRKWEVDNTHRVFEDGVQEIFNNNAKDAIVRYFELTRDMILKSPPHILGHMDKIKMQNLQEKYFSESDRWYKDEILKTLKLVEETDIIIEVNTRGIYQKKTRDPYPSPWILELIHEKKIPVTLSSDAHHPDDLINQFPETSEMLYKIGFRNLAVRTRDGWKQLPFNEHGLIR